MFLCVVSITATAALCSFSIMRPPVRLKKHVVQASCVGTKKKTSIKMKAIKKKQKNPKKTAIKSSGCSGKKKMRAVDVDVVISMETW